MTGPDDRHLLRAAAGGTAQWLFYDLPCAAIFFRPLRRLLGIRAEIESEDAVALTFDDGPHPEGTLRVLELLARADARATFFLVGEQVERFPELAAGIVAAGHEIGVHCHRHRSLVRLWPSQTRNDLRQAAETIRTATGIEPRRYRPPYGMLTMPALREARRQGWETVLWRRDGRDWWAAATPDSIAAKLLCKVRGGDVLLLHDADWYGAPRSWERTAPALELVLEQLAGRGLRVAPL
jgi:peptidoglycan-N-acetylglucosamine deacetylase